MQRLASFRCSTPVLSGNAGVGSSVPLVRSYDDLDIIKFNKRCLQAESTSLSLSPKLRPYSEMPGPKGLPLIGSLWDYVKKDGYRFNKMFEAMTDLSVKYGPVYKETIGQLSHVVITDPLEYAKVVRVDGRFPHRVELEPMVHYKKKKKMGLGTVNSQGEEWYRNRMAIAKKTLRPKEVAQYIPEMCEVGDDFMKRLRDILTPEGHVQNLEQELFKWAFESIGTFLFEERIGCLDPKPSPEAQEFLRHLIGFFKYMQPLMYNLPLYKYYPTATWKKYEEHADRVTEIGMKFINKKVAELQASGPEAFDGDTVSLLTHFMTREDVTPEDANSHALDIMMGGVETTSNATLWTLYLLATTPTAQQTLYHQLSTVVPNNGQMSSEALAKLPYLKACLKETFRLYPITFATSRIIHRDIELAGYHIPAGTHCQANLYGMGRDPKLFPDPLKYKPERWLTDKHEIQTLSTLTWGHGPRMCLGRRLAEQEIYLIISKMIQNFELDYKGTEIKPVLNTVMTPDQPVKLIFKPRRK